MICLLPLNAYVQNQMKALQFQEMQSKDERIKVINELLGGIKVLKLYAWEPYFEEKILKIRDKEVNVIKTLTFFNSTSSFIWTCTPFLVGS